MCVGKVKEKFLKEGVGEYLKRLKRRRVTLEEIPDSNIDKEGILLLEKIRDVEFVVAMSEDGEQISSTEFADFIKKADQDLCFVIGGPDGLSLSVYARADKTVALSMVTFTHEMARLILFEQIYRAFMIAEGRKYHR